MTDNERDTKFLGFAKLLWKELETSISEDGQFLYYFDGIQVEAATLVIAQRAYDLAMHTLKTVPIGSFEREQELAVFDVPDMTEWPTAER